MWFSWAKRSLSRKHSLTRAKGLIELPVTPAASSEMGGSFVCGAVGQLRSNELGRGVGALERSPRLLAMPLTQ
jgi:hypothetical protein